MLTQIRTPPPASRGHSVWRTALLLVGCAISLVLFTRDASAAQPPVGLGTAGSFAVLAGSTVTNTGPSTINGDLGVSPGTAITGFPPGKVNGTTHAADAVAAQAQSDLTTAYNDAAGRTPASAVPADLGGLTLSPGVYRSASSVGLTGSLTLDAQGDPNAVFIFQAGSTLTTASGSRVNLINGAQPCNVVWQIGSSATLGSASVFVGNILALTSISLDDSVTVTGRTLARNGAVTGINDTITATRCAAGTITPPGTAPPGTAPPGTAPPGTAPPGTVPPGTTGGGTAVLTRAPSTRPCVEGFRVLVSGRFIRRVVFSVGGRVVGTRSQSPFSVTVAPGGKGRMVVALVTFTNQTRARRLMLVRRKCATVRRRVPPSPSRPPRRPSGFTG